LEGSNEGIIYMYSQEEFGQDRERVLKMEDFERPLYYLISLLYILRLVG
jgi:hypothetical protein